MGKNSKNRKGTWTPRPVDGSGESTSGPAGQTDEDVGCVDESKLMKGKRRVDELSLKRKKKKKKRKDTINHQPASNTPALRQLLGDSFPRRRAHFDHLRNDQQAEDEEDEEEEEQERFADLSDIVATDWRAEARMPPEGSDSCASVAADDEIYQSRKLVMRQLVMNQLSFIRQHFSAQQDAALAAADDDDPPDEDGGRPADGDGVSDVDSWAEMEERFAEIYQPIPYDVAMDSWRSMTKEQMLKTVTSRRLRSRMKYMSRAEILGQIQTLKLAQHGDARADVRVDVRTKSKSPVYEDVSGSTVRAHQTGTKQPAGQVKKKKRVKTNKAEQQQQHCQVAAPLYQNTLSYQGLSLADIYQAKVEARRHELQAIKLQQKAARGLPPLEAGQNDVYVTKAMVHAPPLVSDDDEDRQRFVSRSSILNKLGTPSTAQQVQSKTELIAQFWRQSDYITTEYSRCLGSGGGVQQQQGAKNPAGHSCSSSSPSTSSCPSDCDCYCERGDACSVCSCSSCGSFRTVRSMEKAVIVTQPAKLERPDAEEKLEMCEIISEEEGEEEETATAATAVNEASKTPEPVPLSLVKQRKMEFERLRVLEEQENRLQELVRRTRSDAAPPAHHRSWLDLAQRARRLEDKWNSARRSASSAAHAIYEPVPASQLLLKKEADDGKARRSKNPNRSRKRSKVIKQLKSRMRENLESESLDPRVRQRRHQELQELLSDAVHAGTQTLTNINLGLIYVPMERQQLDHVKGKNSAKIVGPPGGGLMTLKRDRSQLAGGGGISGGVGSSGGAGNVAIAGGERLSVGEAGRSTDESEDVFGSIDTLIFEPKAGGCSTVTKAEELEEVEERIAQQFDYLNDYGSCHEGDSSSDDAAKLGTHSKNGRRAAAAAVAAASPPRNKKNVTAGPDSGSCAAAASCDAFASEFQSTATPATATTCRTRGDDDDSLASFNSADFQGRHVSKEVHVGMGYGAAEGQDHMSRPGSSRASKSDKKWAVSTLDSENYTNVDTDASWDYYPDGLADGQSPADWLKVAPPPAANQQQPNSLLAVGNLRKKPAEWRAGRDETDETAKLLESLRVAQDLNASSSLRLIFPAATLKLSPAQGNIFTDVMMMMPDAVEKNPVSHDADDNRAVHSAAGQLRDASFDAPLEPDGNVESNGEDLRGTEDRPHPLPALRKRDTMIRELKMRLREKFQCVGDENGSTATVRLSPVPAAPESAADAARFPEFSKKKTKVMSKLESILSSFNALAQMKAEGRVYRTAGPPVSIAAEYYANDVDYESTPVSSADSDDRDFHSTGYPHHLLRQSMVFQKAASMMSEPTIYDPSLPDDVPLHYPDVPHPMEPMDVQFHHQQKLLARALEDHYLLGLDPRLRDFYDNSHFDRQMELHAHEGLYSISNALGQEAAAHHGRKGRNQEGKHQRRSGRRKKERRTTEEETEEEEGEEEEEALIDAVEYAPTWSEMEHQLFADQKAAEHLTTSAAFQPPNMTQSRMSPYNDEWLFWEQLNHLRLTEVDRRRWEEERSRRMLLWIHHTSQASPSCDVPGSQLALPHWWQVLE